MPSRRRAPALTPLGNPTPKRHTGLVPRRSVSLLLLLAAALAGGQTKVAQHGKALTAVYVAADASPAERHAADELAHWLGEMARVTIPVQTTAETLPENAIVVGRGAAAKSLAPDLAWNVLGDEEAIVRTIGARTLVTGGRPRGTLYAAYRLLGRLGCRWWTPWAQTIPHRDVLTLPKDDRDERPAFESRDAFWYPAFDGDWAVRNGTNGQASNLDEARGGKLLYAGGFVHTFYPLVPPATYFASHPEWYSLIDGKRVAGNAQLCTTNPELREFIVAQVRALLRANPEARIVSVSQNDCFNPCQCDRCQALAKAEGSEAGPMIALANYVAEHIEKEFPNVAVDTLAYQYTRKAPKTLRPRPNVIVRLCSIECDFAHPLTAPSNAAFAADLRDWSRLTHRLYVWNYDTNFAHYPQPNPNTFVIGPNERFFHENGVRGLFEQGAYQSNGGEMAELRAWLQARLLWDPEQDDRKLIDEFLQGYYGRAAAPIGRSLRLIADAAQAPATIYDPPTAAFLSFPAMLQAERLWQEAERAVANDPDRLWRVRQGHLAVRYVWLNRWSAFRQEARTKGAAWPLPASRKAVADEWLATATGSGPAGWTPMRLVSEGGLTPQAFVSRFAVDPVEAGPLPPRLAATPLPKELDLKGRIVVDLQDDLAQLANEGDWAQFRSDPAASDGIACWMPSTHHEWAFQLPLGKAPSSFVPGRWHVYVVVRTEGENGFSAGVYDLQARRDLATRTFVGQAGYKAYDLGALDLTKTAGVWVAPPGRGNGSVWIDRVLLVKEP